MIENGIFVKILRSFLSEDIPIRCICCIESDDGIIEGGDPPGNSWYIEGSMNMI